MEFELYNISGKKSSKKVKLNKDIFGVEPNDHAIYLDVKYILNNQRQGTSKAKERGEITGSTRKIKKQKGTGTARAGSIKNPLFRGGGRVFGPKPREYRSKLNKKLRQTARKSVLAYKAKNKELIVLEDFNFDTPSTKKYNQILKDLKIDTKKSLLLFEGADKNVYLSSRNLTGAKVLEAGKLNTYDVLNSNVLLITEAALKKVESILN
ncbi:MAG: 50S ribosomal protein L4 [Flavobacteriales bacterium]|nr:50S ribosomal protein L4 [Flavobacteriales bacterium]